MTFIFLANAVLTFDKKIGFLKNSENLDPELELFLNSIRQFMALIGQSIFSLPWYRLWRTKLYMDFENATNNVYRYVNVYSQKLNDSFSALNFLLSYHTHRETDHRRHITFTIL